MNAGVATEDGLARIWRTAILPLLEEFHYGDESVDVQARYGLPALLKQVRLNADTATADDGRRRARAMAEWRCPSGRARRTR
jgi:hypothetical protein